MSTRGRRLFSALGLIAVAMLLGDSLHKASARIETFPVHRAYGVADGFMHFSIGGLDRLSAVLRDDRGVFLFDYGGDLGEQRNPLFIADFVLSLVPFVQDAEAQRILFANLAYLKEIARPTPGGNLLFPYDFDFLRAGETAPWYSAMAQARIAQAMMWGYRLSGEAPYLDLAKRAILALEEGAPGSVLAKPLADGVWLNEFPRFQYQVLDGSLVAIVGVREVLRGLPAGDPDGERMAALFDRAMRGFKSNYRCFTTPVGGLFFADNGQLPTQAYYDIVMTQLAYLTRIDPQVGPIADAYSAAGMAEWRRFAFYYWYLARKTLLNLGVLGACVR